MTLINNIAKRLAKIVAAVALIGATANAAFAIDASDRAACPGNGCEIVAAAHVTIGQRGTLKIVDEKGRTWSLPRIETAGPDEIVFPRDWENADAVGHAYERYLAALERGDAPFVQISQDGRYHLCIRAGVVECVMKPAP